MTIQRNSFLFYRSYFNAIIQLPKKDRLAFFDSLCQYALDGTEPKFSSKAQEIIFSLMKANIDSCNKRYDANVENGKKGGRPKKKTAQKNPTETQRKPNKNPTKPTQNLNKDKDDNTLGNYHYLKESDSPTGGDKSPPPSNPPVDETVEELKEKLYTKIADLQRREREKKEEARRQSLDEEAAGREAENKIRQEKIEMIRNAKKKGEEVDAS